MTEEQKVSDRQVIDDFHNEYFFLSNFYKCTIVVDGIAYPTVEHAFQAAKVLDTEVKKTIAMCSRPNDAKKLGQKVKLRDHWEEAKEEIMYNLLLLKFTNKDLKEKLLATADAKLIEGNWWGDRYWGICNGTGLNKLGNLLMKVREFYRDDVD